ncbi:MAG: hypothetical protein EBR02_00515 [Alphaproteobacteria bacterium]|nr:hypothetical protein [Alphaproteobacteria bacterium]
MPEFQNLSDEYGHELGAIDYSLLAKEVEEKEFLDGYIFLRDAGGRILATITATDVGMTVKKGDSPEIAVLSDGEPFILTSENIGPFKTRFFEFLQRKGLSVDVDALHAGIEDLIATLHMPPSLIIPANAPPHRHLSPRDYPVHVKIPVGPLDSKQGEIGFVDVSRSAEDMKNISRTGNFYGTLEICKKETADGDSTSYPVATITVAPDSIALESEALHSLYGHTSYSVPFSRHHMRLKNDIHFKEMVNNLAGQLITASTDNMVGIVEEFFDSIKEYYKACEMTAQDAPMKK